MITEERAERAAEYIRDNAAKYAEAKGNRIYLDQYRKSLKAIKMNECQGTDKTREAFAYSDEEYLANIKALGDAVQIEETIRWEMVAAQQVIEIWRTQQANNRAVDRAHN
jgi:hypothetical protein